VNLEVDMTARYLERLMGERARDTAGLAPGLPGPESR